MRVQAGLCTTLCTMARPPDGPTARDVTVTFRLAPTEAVAMDAKRGGTSRSDYLRRLITKDTRTPRTTRPERE